MPSEAVRQQLQVSTERLKVEAARSWKCVEPPLTHVEEVEDPADVRVSDLLRQPDLGVVLPRDQATRETSSRYSLGLR